jgi:hypothetical protein
MADKMNGYYPGYENGCPEPCTEIVPQGDAYEKWHGRMREVVLNASTGSAGPLPILTTTLSSPINVVSTSINTNGLGNTNTLLTFTGIISLPLGISVTFNFQIQRVYNNGTPLNVGSTYTFSTAVVVLESEAFSFQFLDSNVPEGYYTYSVSLSTNSIVDVTPGATINSAVLSALAVAV